MRYQHFRISRYIDDYETPGEALVSLVDKVNEYTMDGWKSQGIKKAICPNTGLWRYTVEMRYYIVPIMEIADAVCAHEALVEQETKNCFWQHQRAKQLMRKAG